MAIDLLTLMPDPPLPTDPEELFDQRAGETLTAEQHLVNVDLNTKLIPQMNLATAKVTADKNAAAQSATDAAGSATAAGQQVGLAAAEVTKAADQVQLAVVARTGAETARDSAQAAAAAAGSAAGLPSLAGSANKFLGVNPAGDAVGWYDAGQQVGDLLWTARAPGNTYLPAAGGVYLKASYPALAALMGAVSDLPNTAPVSKLLPSSATWSDLVFSTGVNSKFVAVAKGPSAVSAYSLNGISWTSLAMPSSQNWAGVAANGSFTAAIAAGTNILAYLQTSLATPGWSQSALLPVTANWVDIASDGSNFLALASDGQTIASSSSINTWASVGGAPAGTYAACIYGGGRYVATGTVTARRVSATWVASSRQPAAPLGCLTYGAGLYVGLGSGNSNVAAISKDGDVWDSVTLPLYGNWTSVSYGAGYFVAVSAGNSPSVIYSADGYNWQVKAANVTGGRSAIAYGANAFAILPASGTTAESWLSYSYDTSTQFVAPNAQAAPGSSAYIKAKAA